jgi:hypothetical protein
MASQDEFSASMSLQLKRALCFRRISAEFIQGLLLEKRKAEWSTLPAFTTRKSHRPSREERLIQEPYD